MGLLTFSINVTLDGCVDHQEGIADDETHAFFTRLMADAGAMLWGRVTYEMMESSWPAVARGEVDVPPAMRAWADTLEAKPKYVVSSTRTDFPWTHSHHLAGDLRTGVQALKDATPAGVLLGSGQLATELDRLELIDEYRFLVRQKVGNAIQRMRDGVLKQPSWKSTHPVIRIVGNQSPELPVQRITENRFHVANLTDRPGFDHPSGAQPHRVKQLIMPHTHLQSGLTGHSQHGVGFVNIQREWFLDIHVATGLQQLHCQLGMRMSWRGDVHNIGASLRQQGIEMCILRHTKASGCLIGQILMRIADTHHVRTANSLQLTQMRIGNLSAAQHGHADAVVALLSGRLRRTPRGLNGNTHCRQCCHRVCLRCIAASKSWR